MKQTLKELFSFFNSNEQYFKGVSGSYRKKAN